MNFGRKWLESWLWCHGEAHGRVVSHEIPASTGRTPESLHLHELWQDIAKGRLCKVLQWHQGTSGAREHPHNHLRCRLHLVQVGGEVLG